MATRLLRAGVMALGGAGRSIAGAFESLGYSTFSIDFSPSLSPRYEGFSLGAIPPGSAYSREDVIQKIEHERSQLRTLIEGWARKQGIDCVLLCAGLAGRTGSSVESVATALRDLGLSRLILAALPESHEGPIGRARAAVSLECCIQSGLDGLILIDNDRLPGVLAVSSIEDDFTVANALLAKAFDDANACLDRPDAARLKPVPSDLVRGSLVSGGLITFGSLSLAIPEGELDPERVSQEIKAFILNPGALVPLDDSPDAALVLAIVEASPSHFGHSVKVFSDSLTQSLSRDRGGFACVGLYGAEGSDGAQCDLVTVHAGLPSRIDQFMREVAEEGRFYRSRICLPWPKMEEEEAMIIHELARGTQRDLAQTVNQDLNDVVALPETQAEPVSQPEIIAPSPPPAPDAPIHDLSLQVMDIIEEKKPEEPVLYPEEPPDLIEESLEELEIREELDLSLDEMSVDVEDLFIPEENDLITRPVVISEEELAQEALRHEALKTEGSEPAPSPELALSEEFVPVAADLGNANPMDVRRKAVSFLLRKLKHPESAVRMQALSLLGKAEGFTIWPKIHEMLSDRSPDVQALAKEILRKEPK